MATFKPILNPKPKKDGTYAILIRITENRKHKYISIPYSIPEKDWYAYKNPKAVTKQNNAGIKQYIKKSHLQHAVINKYLHDKIIECIQKAEEVKTKSAPRIKQAIVKPEFNSFIEYAEKVYNNIKKNPESFNTWKKYYSTINKLKDYIKTELLEHDLDFADLTYDFLTSYKAYLYSPPLNNKKNTVAKDFSVMRAIVHRAIKSGLIKVYDNPFIHFTIESERTSKQALTATELEIIENVKLKPGTGVWHARNYFMLAYYFRGIRAGDFIQLKYKHFSGSRINYITEKTDHSINLKIPPKALHYLSLYLYKGADPERYVFPLLDNDKDYSNKEVLFKDISAKLSLINKNLKKVATKAEISKNLSFHISRHTFASIARDKLKGDVSTIKDLLGHSSISITQGYLASLTDESLDTATDQIYD